MGTPTRRWAIERRIGYPAIQEVALSPDGRRALYVVREPLMTDDRSEFISHLYLASEDGAEPIQLTFGEQANSGPRWSSDGQYIAFLSKRSGKANVYAMRASGGEAWALTGYDKTDVVRLRWSPDGGSIGFLMAEPPTDEKEKARKAKDDAVQWDVDFDFAHLYVVPFAVGPRTPPAPRQITRGRYHVADFDWLPDGNTIAFTHRPTPVTDSWPETRLAVIRSDVGDGEPTDLAVVADPGARPIPSPDGRWITCHTSDQPVSWAFAGRIVLYPVGGGEPHPLAHTPDGHCVPIGWSADGREFYVLDASGLTTQVWALPASGASGRQVTDTTLLKTWPAASSNDQIAFIGQDFHQPNAVYLLDVASGTTREIARPSLPADWPDAPMPQVEAIRWQAPDATMVEGILVYPLDFQAGRRHPLVVAVHGGPAGVYQRSYIGAYEGYADILALAERGYAVLRGNPRGSTGYGRRFRFANYHDWGGGDFQDIMAGVDYLIARGVVDSDRLAIMGWSYGGYITSWAITQTHRFRAACVGAGVTNPVSFNGTSDIPSFVPDYFGGEFWDDLEAYRQHSPALNAKGVRTPTLIQHGDQDVRVPLGQGREFYNALRRQGVPVEMVIYPRQGHAIDEPRLLMDVRRRAVAWIERWLGDGGDAQSTG